MIPIRSGTVLALLLAAAAPAAPPVVVVARPVPAEAAYYEFRGRFEPADRLEVRAAVKGSVAKVHVRAGDEVTPGQLLIELDPGRLDADIADARALAGKAEAEVKKWQAEVDRLKKAEARAQDVAVAAAKRDLAAVRLKLAQEEVARLRADLELTRVKAPAGGRICRPLAAVGDPVDADPAAATLLAVIARTEPVRVAFDVTVSLVEAMRERYREIEKTTGKAAPPCRVLLKLPGEKGFPHQGSVDYVDRQPDRKTRLVAVHVAFTPDRALTAAALAAHDKDPPLRLRVPLDRLQKGLLVPALAVGGRADGKPVVLVVDKDNVVQERVVRPGGLFGGLLLLEDGLTADDRVVVPTRRAPKGADQTLSPADFVVDARFAGLKPGTTVKPLEARLPSPQADND